MSQINRALLIDLPGNALLYIFLETFFYTCCNIIWCCCCCCCCIIIWWGCIGMGCCWGGKKFKNKYTPKFHEVFARLLLFSEKYFLDLVYKYFEFTKKLTWSGNGCRICITRWSGCIICICCGFILDIGFVCFHGIFKIPINNDDAHLNFYYFPRIWNKILEVALLLRTLERHSEPKSNDK